MSDKKKPVPDTPIKIGLGIQAQGKVFMDFGKSVKCITLTPLEAINLGNLILQKGQQALTAGPSAGSA